MSVPSHIDESGSTSTAAASTTTISDGRTKHRAVGANDDDAPLVGTGAKLHATATCNGSSNGGKRKQAAGMFCVDISCFFSLLLLIFFFFAAASTSNALRTSESLNAEKAKLEARKEKLEDELEAGVSEALEVAIRQQIAGIYTRIAAVQADITAIRTQITASINAPSKPSRATDVEMPPGTTCGIVCFFLVLTFGLPQST
jgi:hypothetical protein